MLGISKFKIRKIEVIFLREVSGMLRVQERIKMSKSKKSKREGLERHRQLVREKKLKLKERRKVSLPQKHLKGKK